MPERLIQTAKGTEEKLRNMDPTKTFSNNPLEVLETNMCMTCEEKEMCGVYATTRAMEKKKEEKERKGRAIQNKNSQRTEQRQGSIRGETGNKSGRYSERMRRIEQ